MMHLTAAVLGFLLLFMQAAQTILLTHSGSRPQTYATLFAWVGITSLTWWAIVYNVYLSPSSGLAYALGSACGAIAGFAIGRRMVS